jgi:uncharacterized protein (TIGR01777 family)
MNPSPRKLIIAGGSGFLGRNLAHAAAAAGYAPCLLSRNAPKGGGPWRFVPWDGRTVGDWVTELDGATAIVNLAGRSVDCVKSPDNCDLILRSRVETTRVLGEAVRLVDNPPPVWVQMSTAHIYGDPPTAVCTESAPFGYGLAPYVGQAWESAFREAVLPEMRSVILRTSFVLGKNGGAFPKLRLLARLGLGGRVGSGRQGISWLHEEDMNRLFLYAIEQEQMEGAYIATAPHPVSQAELMRGLRRELGMPVGLPAAGWMVRMAAPLLKTDAELLLFGRYCRSERLPHTGFHFLCPTITEALHALCQ